MIDMNREIKFRAWINGDMKPVAILHNTPHPARVIDMNFETDHVNALLLPAETPVMQYTGLKDKNGVEVYEGDIVKYYLPDFDGTVMIENIEVVTFESGGFSLDGHFPLSVALEDDCVGEVVGNIHQHSHLLNKE